MVTGKRTKLIEGRADRWLPEQARPARISCHRTPRFDPLHALINLLLLLLQMRSKRSDAAAAAAGDREVTWRLAWRGTLRAPPIGTCRRAPEF
jgi:hypothetical protein